MDRGAANAIVLVIVGKAVLEGRFAVLTMGTRSERPRYVSSNLPTPESRCHNVCAPCTTILQQATLACGRLKKKCLGGFIGKACGKMTRITFAVLVLKSATHPNSLRRLLSSLRQNPLQMVAIDIVGPTPQSASGHEWLLVVSYHFTKFAQAFPVRNTSAVTLAKKVMDEYICRFGCFEGLHSDQGAYVDGAVFRGLCDLINEAKTSTTPYHPQRDGQGERLNKSLVKILAS